MAEGLLIVISGPSGVGKGTIIDALLKDNPKLSFSISATTRGPRPNERDGVEYHFIPESEFLRKIMEDEFLEYAKVHGCYYGTPRGNVREKLSRGEDVLLDIDVQGGLQVRKRFPHGVFIFLVPPTFDELRRRLELRHTEDPGAISHRLADAKEELEHMGEYDYLVTNDALDNAVADVKAIVRAEKCKLSRRHEEIRNALSPSR